MTVHLLDATQRLQQAQVSFSYLPQLHTVCASGASKSDADILGSLVPLDLGSVWPSEAAKQLLPEDEDQVPGELQAKPYR